MNRYLWSRQIQRWLSGSREPKGRPARRAVPFRPVLEHLESRLVPTIQTFNPVDTAGLISDLNLAQTPGKTTVINLNAGTTYTLTAVNNFWYGPTGLPAIDSEVVIHGNGATIARDS